MNQTLSQQRICKNCKHFRKFTTGPKGGYCMYKTRTVVPGGTCEKWFAKVVEIKTEDKTP